MADLDPATLEKFQRFQAMLAASPEIVEALNSPEILALAAKTAAEKKQQLQGQQQQPAIAPTPTPPPPPAPKPPPSAPVSQYPIVGYGISDDISVLSEMTTPTVMTRQTVEEDEFYPEVDGAGLSSSGKPRRIGLKIGVSSSEGGRLPPPPPKSSNARQLRQVRVPRKARAMAAPMSKITETQDAASLDHDKESTDEEPEIPNPPARMGTSWSPSERSRKKQGEAHPYFGSVGAGAVSRPARQATYDTRNRWIKGRGVNRNRSMPNTLQRMSVSSMSESSATDGDESSTFISAANGSSNSTTAESETTAVESNQQPPATQKVRSKASLSTPKERGVIRNRSMPLRADGESTNTSTEAAFKAVGGTVASSSKSLSDGDEETITEKGSTTEKSSLVDGDSIDGPESAGEKTPRTKNAPRMRLVPVVGKGEEPKKPRSRSLSKDSNKNLRGNISSSDEDDNDHNVSRSSAPISSKSLTNKRQPRSRSLSKFSNKSLTGNSSSDDDDDDKNVASTLAPRAASSSKLLTQQRQPRSRSLSKFSNRRLRDNKSDTDDDASRSSAPVKSLSASSTASNSIKRLVPADPPKKPRSRSLSKYSNIRERLKGNNSSDDDDNVSRSSAPAVSSTDSGKMPFRKPRRLPSLTTDEDDCGQPSLPQRVPSGNDEYDKGFTSNLSSDAEESDDINSLGSDTKPDSDDSSSEDEKEKRPSVVRRWKPPSNDNSTVPSAFRFSNSSNHSGKLSNSNHSGKFSRSNHSHKSNEGKALKKGRKPTPHARSMSFTKSGSDEEKQSRTEQQNTTSSSDSEEAYVRQTVRKPGQPKQEPGESLYQSPDPALFEQNFAELNQVIQNDTARPSDYIGADGAFGGTRRKRGQPKKKALNRSTTSAPRETDWLGAGGPKKRTWKVKSVKEVS